MKYLFEMKFKEKLIPIFLFTFIFISNFLYPLIIVASNSNHETMIVSGVVPHHLLAETMIDHFFKHMACQGKIENIILLSPDHFQSAVINHHCSFITSVRQLNSGHFMDLPFKTDFTDGFSKEIKINDNCSAIAYDHGITNLLPFIKKYLPKANILPILIPEGTTEKQIEQLVKLIDKNTSPLTVMIASVDFSHYLPANAAAFHDIKSIRTLLNFEKDDFKNIEVDCWQALYAIRFFAILRHGEIPQFIDYKCADDFLNLQTNETTSYFSLVYGSNFSNGVDVRTTGLNKSRDVKTILFTGDIMLDRGVKECMQKNSFYYPFSNIHQFLRGIDRVFGNLEGPIVDETPDFSHQSLRFAFGIETLKSISSACFNLLSLANNHTLDMGISGFNETIKHLEEYHIHSTGNPFYDQPHLQGSAFISDDIVFSAFNRILPFKRKDSDILKTIKELHVHHPEKWLVVSMHWGNEYQENCSPAQKQLAQRMIEAGADIIIGHHPHVVQGIERYLDGIIFYSLGNFVFDQSFSEETQKGLAVGLEAYPGQLIFRLFPIQIDLCQPALMDNLNTRRFLKELAKRSDAQLVDEIERGIIIVKRR